LNFYYKLNKVLCELPATRNIKKRPGNIRGATRLLGGREGDKAAMPGRQASYWQNPSCGNKAAGALFISKVSGLAVCETC
ncbi:hypothetical protein, partial [Brucella canis]|uniref:hypothetical protein n=1 Tax=Brucella canis TaxID=36855 RepID=UPI00196329D1